MLSKMAVSADSPMVIPESTETMNALGKTVLTITRTTRITLTGRAKVQQIPIATRQTITRITLTGRAKMTKTQIATRQDRIARITRITRTSRVAKLSIAIANPSQASLILHVLAQTARPEQKELAR